MMNRRLLSTLAVALALPTLTACGLRNELLQGLPSSEDVQIKVPGSEGGQALSIGETSEFYEATWRTSRGVNGGILMVFGLIDRITNYPATTVDEDTQTAVWGPSEPEGLERNAWRFTAQKVEEGQFTYVLEARPKGSEDEADWQAVFDGVAFPAEDSAGTGTLNLHFGVMNELNDDCLTGDAVVTYDGTLEGRRQVDVAFNGFGNTCEDEDVTVATYHYGENDDASGDFEFSFNGNIHQADESKPLIETFTIKSRWLGTGTGRSDVIISGGEVPGDLATHLPDSDATSVMASECWDDNFALTYSDTNPEELRDAIRPLLGDASACPFEDAEYPTEEPAI
jgi:hypothetical protein